MDAIALIQELSAREQGNSHIQQALKEAAQLIGPAMTQLETLLTEVCSEEDSGTQAPCLHIIEAGGKRIRPIVCLLAYKTAGGGEAPPLDLAISCELLHNATLLHDDVIDDGEIRRGRPSAKMVYGNALSVLGGDYLLVRTVEMVSKRDPRFMAPFVHTLKQLIEGELIQLKRRGSILTTEEEYFKIIEGKTASLFRWAAIAGATAASVGEETATRLGQFGWHTGVAFQLIDDVLDISASPDQLGKNLLADIREGKMTLPVILACQTSDEVKALLEQLLDGNEGSDAAQRIAHLVNTGGQVEQARTQAARHTRQALDILDNLSGLNDHALGMLRDLSSALLERHF